MYEFDPERLQRLEALRAASTDPYPTGFAVTHSSRDLERIFKPEPAPAGAAPEGAAGDAAVSDEALAAAGEICFAGRILFKNEMGKAGFARLLDQDGRFQIYVRKDDVGPEGFGVWKALVLGDWVWVRGVLMRTRTGEPTLKVAEIRLAAACLTPLPDKWHGLTDPEIRQRQRYLDLFVSPESRETFRKRSQIIAYIRNFFAERRYMEVETPMMHPIPGGATARPFRTHHNALDMDLFLRVAPELYLKRLIVGGLDRVFEINRNFRNEGIDSTHNPEFTMLEFYEAFATWEHLMDMTEALIAGCVQAVCGTTAIPYQGHTLSFDGPWRRARYDDLVAEALSLPVEAVHDRDALVAAYAVRFPDAKPDELPASVAHIWERVFDICVEKTLIQPTFVTAFPVAISPLARRSDSDPRIADRFELFIAGREIANGFNELNDPVDQAARFEAQVKARAAGDQEAMHFDADYIRALCYGMPPTAGEGLGIDRLAMLLTDAASIRDVLLFPSLRAKATS